MAETSSCLIYGKIYIDLVSRSVYEDGQEIIFTRMEFDVLCFLASNPNIAFAKEQIYEAVKNTFLPAGRFFSALSKMSL